MNSKNTFVWVIVAVVLGAFIFLYQKYEPKPETGPAKVLPGLNTNAVTSVQVSPAGQRVIRVERTNDSWRLTQPLVYPAQKIYIEKLLAALEALSPAPYITIQELKNHPRADAEFGFDSPLVSLIVQQGDQQKHILIGKPTAPGDQVFVQVIGAEGVYVVDADFLRWVPRSANDWRDTTFVDLNSRAFDRLIVTNAGKTQPLELQRNGTNKFWQMTSPLKARADSAKVEDSLRQLQNLRVGQFFTDDPKADLEPLGLQPPELSIALNLGTNAAQLLEFGKSPTNGTNYVYARLDNQSAIVLVPKIFIEPWLASHETFRSRHLLALSSPLDEIEIHAEDSFVLQREGSNAWRFVSQNFTPDAALVQELIGNLTSLQVVEFVKNVVTEPDLPKWGLAPPLRQFILKTAAAKAVTGTNDMIAQIDFGTNQEDKVFARRTDERDIYAVKPADFQLLPKASWRLRERRIWNFSETNVARLTIQQNGKTRELLRDTTNEWSFAPGSQGVINAAAVEEAVHRLGELSATAWTDRGDEAKSRYGFKQENQHLTVELKDGQKLNVEFGGEAPSQFPYAAVTLDNQTWIFEFPWTIYQLVRAYLTIP